MRMSPILILAMLAALPVDLDATQPEEHPSYTLVLRSSDLPESDRQDILKSIDVSACPPEIVSEIVARMARDLGYLQAAVAEQKNESENHIQLTETVTAGARYRLRTINIVRATVFTADQLRSEISIAPGDVVSGSEIAGGLEKMRALYAGKGYINTVITPTAVFDPRQELVDFTFNVDEGTPYQFGDLLLNGVEPYPGAAKQLTASWKPIRGQLFNPSLLNKWLQANKSSCASCTNRSLSYTERNLSSHSNLVDVTLELPTHPLP